MTVSVERVSENYDQLTLQVDCVAHTDGTFTSKAITTTEAGLNYYNQGYYLYNVVAVNPASTYPTVAAPITIADANGYPILASGELAASTSASTKTEATIAKYRPVSSALTISIGDTGTAANTLTLYITLAR